MWQVGVCGLVSAWQTFTGGEESEKGDMIPYPAGSTYLHLRHLNSKPAD